jgi:heme/copper-type cytochrome/quinol oxidase subunit 2
MQKAFKRSFALFLILMYTQLSWAQCAMCRAAIESEGNKVKAQAVNDGIVYLMLIPYILVAVGGYLAYRLFRPKKS